MKLKNTLRFLAIAIILGFGAIIANAEKFDPAKAWQKDIAMDTQKLSEAYQESVKMCKICAAKALKHQETMGSDDKALAELAEYQRKLQKYCGPLTSAETQIDKEKAAKAIKEAEQK